MLIFYGEEMITNIDFTILDFINAYLTSPLGDKIMPVVTGLGDNGIIWIVITVFLLFFRKTRRLGAAAAIALVLEALLCNVIIKPLVMRPRPFDLNSGIELLISAPDDFSFPSGHTGASFAAFGALFFGRKKLAPTGKARSFWIPALIMAILIAVSRLYLYVHYPTDVAAGAVLGTLCGYAGVRVASYIAGKLLK